jgi:hypothetical protein
MGMSASMGRAGNADWVMLGGAWVSGTAVRQAEELMRLRRELRQAERVQEGLQAEWFGAWWVDANEEAERCEELAVARRAVVVAKERLAAFVAAAKGGAA